MYNDNPPPEYKRIYGQNIDMFRSNTDDPDKLVESVIEVLNNHQCIQVETFYKNKWTLLWTCYNRWYMQFDFTVSIYTLDNKPVVVFGKVDHIEIYMDYIKLLTHVVNECDEINPGKLGNYNIETIDENIKYKKVDLKNIDYAIDIILNCYDIDYRVYEAKQLVLICDGNSEYHYENQKMIIENYPNIIKQLLHSTKSILLEACGQALLHILLREKQEIAVKKLGYIDYNPMNDRDLSIAEDFAIKLSSENEIKCL
tara:strand:- start:4566 stop:5333 length:768 start_codon:yes stop_codon:yes gene_type:complete